MNREQRALHEDVLWRDHGRCQECGRPSREVHHILSRKHPWAWDERNMITLCTECHLYKDGGAHRHAKRKEHLELLENRHGYVYSEPYYLSALERMENHHDPLSHHLED